jgi:hypothetical protein
MYSKSVPNDANRRKPFKEGGGECKGKRLPHSSSPTPPRFFEEGHDRRYSAEQQLKTNTSKAEFERETKRTRKRQ